MARFILVFSLLLTVVMFYLGWRLAESLVHWILLAAMAMLILMLPTFYWNSESDKYPVLKNILQQVSYLSMALISCLFVLCALRDLVLIAVTLTAGADQAAMVFNLTGGTIAFLAAALVTLVGFWRAIRGPRVRQVTVPIAGLPTILSGLHIVQISDLHVGPTIGRRYVERLLQMVDELKPDLTVLTGDIVDGDVEELRDVVAPLSRLFPYGRVFFVPGNHEYYWDIDTWTKEFRRLGATVLLNSGEYVKHNGHQFWIGGVTDPAALQTHSGKGPDVKQAYAGAENADFRLLLSHRPGFVVEAAAAGFHLQLSGHTHGGQFFPWTYILRIAHRFFIGLIKYDNIWLYVSPGTGSWGPPMRLGTTPEVTSIRIETAPAGS